MELQAFERNEKLSALRRQGLLPAIVYNKERNLQIAVEERAFDKAFRKVSTHGLITLHLGQEKIDTVVKAVAMDKRKRGIFHVDFYAVSDEPIEVSVPVHLQGVARGVKEDGGVLDIVAHNVVVKVSPRNIPNEILVDVSNIGLNQPVHASDLVLPAGAELAVSPDLTILTIHQSRAAVENAAAANEPEVVGKGKAKEAE